MLSNELPPTPVSGVGCGFEGSDLGCVTVTCGLLNVLAGSGFLFKSLDFDSIF
jgi:hypothetical protein